MKSKTTKILALTAALCGLHLSAATKLAVFEGADLNGGTVGGYTLNRNGNSYADGAVTISSGKGLSLTSSSTWNGSEGITVAIKYESLVRGSGSKEIATFKLGSKSDCVGVRMDSSGNSAGTYEGNDWSGEGKGAVKEAVPASDVVFVSFRDDEYTKMFGTDSNGLRGSKLMYFGNGLRESGQTVGGLITVAATSTGGKVASGMVITGIAVFRGFMVTAEMNAFRFPTELDKMYSNRLSGGNVTVTPGTYGAITVPGGGYKATAITSWADLSNTASGEEITGSYANIIKKAGDDGDTRQHTFAGWFCPASLSSEQILWFAYSKGFIGSSDNGYKVCATTAGKIKIVKTSGDANDNGTAIYSSDVVMAAGTWAHIAVAFEWGGGGSGKRWLKPTLYVNGQKKALSDSTATIGSNLAGGENGAAVRLGNGISAAGIYVDNTALYDGRAVVKAATGFAVTAPFVATVTQNANWANLSWTPSKPSAGADVKLIRGGDAADAKVTIDEDVNLAKLTVTSSSGKSLTLKVDNTLTAATYNFSGTVKIGGAGRVEYTTSGTEPAYPAWTWVANGDDEWTGTYALSGFNGAADATTCKNNGWDLRPYYNGAKSTFEFNGTVTEGWFNNVPFSVGELVLPRGKSITFTNGHTSETSGGSVNNYCFTKLSGEGSITINTSSTASPGVKISDVSEFAGTISNTGLNSDGNGYRVILGEGELKAVGDNPAKAAIHLTGNVTLNSLTLNASNGVKITGDAVVTVVEGKTPQCSSGVMTFADGSSLVFEDKASRLWANGGISVDSSASIPLKVVNSAGLSKDTYLVTWTTSAQPAGTFALDLGTSREKGEHGLSAEKTTTGLKLNEVATKTYYEVEGGETTTFDNQWLTDAKITGSTEQVQTALNTPNANGIKPSDAYLMGYEAKDAQNAAVILKPDQAQSNGETISLSVAGVPNETRNGAVITYTAQASADRNWESPTETVPMGTGSVSMALPTSGVLYYRVQATVALP